MSRAGLLLLISLLLTGLGQAQERKSPVAVTGEFRVYRNLSGAQLGRFGQTRVLVVGEAAALDNSTIRKFRLKAIILNAADGQVLGETKEQVSTRLTKGRSREFEFNWYTPPALDNHPAFLVQIVYLYENARGQEESGSANLPFNEDPNYVPVNN